jgi:hypothetical protein
MAKTIVNKGNHRKLGTYYGLTLIYKAFGPSSFVVFL